MRVLAIDHGTKRMGLALSDETRTIAQPLPALPAKPLAEFFAQVRDIIEQKNISQILVGMPRNMDGTLGEAAERVNRFITILQKEISTPVQTWDERLSSSQANRSLIAAGVRRTERKEKVDSTAAAILLQSYLDNRS